MLLTLTLLAKVTSVSYRLTRPGDNLCDAEFKSMQAEFFFSVDMKVYRVAPVEEMFCARYPDRVRRSQ